MSIISSPPGLAVISIFSNPTDFSCVMLTAQVPLDVVGWA